MPGRLPGGGGIQAEFCGMAQPWEEEQVEKQTAQGPRSKDLSDVQPGQSR